ncbi:hypothetical protein PsorP6_003035 [Peronosclerospora sorghi]|uniref:Uncharacterized protein n=1 Tax=Peronosclerospora sorghi TaxID=230839 RepID=A0ACC0VQF4_9STRA|nr:hypothetical protein PsorP6_003035 [Peronosclerospora sorghi]
MSDRVDDDVGASQITSVKIRRSDSAAVIMLSKTLHFNLVAVHHLKALEWHEDASIEGASGREHE